MLTYTRFHIHEYYIYRFDKEINAHKLNENLIYMAFLKVIGCSKVALQY